MATVREAKEKEARVSGRTEMKSVFNVDFLFNYTSAIKYIITTFEKEYKIKTHI